MSSLPPVGQRLSYDGALCTVRYVGEVAGTKGQWLGVEWDDPTRGKHDGRHKGNQYFKCLSTSTTSASFIRPSRPTDTPQSFISALHQKYASEVDASNVPIPSKKQIEISGKVVEEVGFDKIRAQLARVQDLKIVILDGMRVASVREADEKVVGETCPKITELDLSRNLFVGLGVVVGVCGELKGLRSLRLNGNRFRDVLRDESLNGAAEVFQGVKELSLEETLLTWEEIHHITTKFTSLHSLNCGTNQLASIPDLPLSSLSSTLTTLNLEFNEFKSLSDILPLTSLRSLRNLHLKGNNISTITSSPSAPHPVFSPTIQYLDMSYNVVPSWTFVDSLQTVFPGLTALRLAHNPIYDTPDPAAVGHAMVTTDEAFMITVARLPSLKTLNFVSMAPTDRSNAEMFYLSRIARQLATVPEGQESSILSQHPRWTSLCEVYGEPDVFRRQETNPEFLEARLISVNFSFTPPLASSSQTPQPSPPVKKTRQIPRSFDIYAVKGIAGRLFNLPPPSLKLVWETGEWDPVAGFDDEEGHSSEEEDAVVKLERVASELTGTGGDGDGGEGVTYHVDRKTGMWVKREMELRDGPRQLGFCVDGLEARIRVEVR